MNVPVRSRRIAAATVTGAAVLSSGALVQSPGALADGPPPPPAAQTAATAPTSRRQRHPIVDRPEHEHDDEHDDVDDDLDAGPRHGDAAGNDDDRHADDHDAHPDPDDELTDEAGAPAGEAQARKPGKPKASKRKPPGKLAPLPPTPASIFGSPFGTGLTFPDVVSQFPIPLSLLPIYQAAGIQYGVRWEVLAAINRVETNFGQDLSVSSAGAEGWMQFLPSSWAQYGMDADGDGHKNPYDPVDAIFAAAHYLEIAGAGARPPGRDLLLQPLRRVRRLGADVRASDRERAGAAGERAERRQSGLLPGPRPGQLPGNLRHPGRGSRPERAHRAGGGVRRHHRPGPRRGGRERDRPRCQARLLDGARSLHRTARRVRHDLHVRRPRLVRAVVSGTAVGGDRGRPDRGRAPGGGGTRAGRRVGTRSERGPGEGAPHDAAGRPVVRGRGPGDGRSGRERRTGPQPDGREPPRGGRGARRAARRVGDTLAAAGGDRVARAARCRRVRS